MDVGERAPDVSLRDQTGKPRRLSELAADGPVVLFFFPIASSTGCTAEACHFRDRVEEFTAAGATVVGCSTDSRAAHRQFDSAHSLGYTLLSDPDGEAAAQFGVKRSGLLGKIGPVQRRTFVLGTDLTVLAVVSGERKPHHHADDALAALTS